MSVTPGKGAPWQAVLGAGGVLGVSSGYAAKKIGKAALFATGVAVLFLQFLASRGVISVDWTRVGDKVTEQLDADGDGKLTHRDLGVGLRAVGSARDRRRISN